MHERVCGGVTLVGGAQLTGPGDCLSYAVDVGELVLVDCGLGPGWLRLRENLRGAGHDPDRVHTLLLTHCHADHMGAAAAIVAETRCRVVAHELDAPAIESGDPRMTAAEWYDVELRGVAVDQALRGDEVLAFSAGELQVVHTPGHTPGSVAVVLDTADGRVLFGQDVHGPFSPAFGSDRAAWRSSMDRLLDLEADILCEGHFGVFQPASEVRGFIEAQIAAQSRR